MSPRAVHQRLVKTKLCALFDELFEHDGYADLRVEIRLLSRGQKEVILYCGKQYRFVLDFKSRKGVTAGMEAASQTLACEEMQPENKLLDDVGS